MVREALSARGEFRLLDCGEEMRVLKAAGELAWDDVEALTREGFLQTLPGVHPCDGFFAAVVEGT